MLQGIGAISLLSTLGITQTPRTVAQTSSVELDIDLSNIADDVRNPLLMVNHSLHGLQERNLGWDEADKNQVIDEILRLDPEVLNELDLTGFNGPPEDTGMYPPRNQAVQEFAYDYHLPYTNGVHWEFNPDQLHENWYSRLPDEEKWEYPDGSVVEHPSEILAEHFDGEHQIRAEGHENLIPSMFAEGSKERLVKTGQQLFNLGVNQFWIDSPVQGLSFGFDFSIWAQHAFRNHLKSLSRAELDELEIEDPETFNVVDYFSAQNITPDETNRPHSDPVFREFTRFQHYTKNTFVADVFEDAQADLPAEVEEAGTTVFGLGFGLQYNYLTPASIYKSDAVDVISIETQPTVPPDRPHDVTVKIGRAAGKFEKPVRVWGRMNEPFGTTDGLDPSEYYETLMQFQMAQAYAHGGRRNIPLTALPNHGYDQVINSWMRPDGSISEELHGFVDFIRAHRRFLMDVSEANRVAIAVSLPTLLWQRIPEWGLYNPRHSQAVGEAAITLRREHMPYDVVILDHPPLWSDSDQLSRLAEYDCLLLPGVECVSDEHVEAIETALDEGTSVIASGGAPTRDEDYLERDDLAARLDEHAAVTVIDAEPDITGTGESADALRDAVREVNQQVVLDTDADVSLNVVEQSDPGRVLVHLLNFEYERDTDTMQELEEVSLSVEALPFSPEVASYYTVDGITELNMEVIDTGVSVTVPRLDVWGFVAFGETADALTAPVSESEARESISDAEEVLDEIDDPHAYPEGRIATAKMQNTEPALGYEGYGVAQGLAEDAKDFATMILEGEASSAEDMVGFTPIAALASLLGAGYLLSRRNTDENE